MPPYFKNENKLSKTWFFYYDFRFDIILDWGLFVVQMRIGIDPSVNKSGVAVLENGCLTMCESKRLWDLFDFIRENPNAHFYVENSNLDSDNWHGATARGSVGKNKGVSKIIVDLIEAKKYKLTQLKPAGYSIRFKDERIFKKATGFEKQTNKDARAAACMIWGRK